MFMHNCIGESEGAPRYMEEPVARIEDIRCSVEYLTTLNYVDEDRIGVLGLYLAIRGFYYDKRSA